MMLYERNTMNVLFFGGSITAGANAAKYENSWAYQVSEYLNNRLSGIKLNFINAGLSGTGTGIGALRLNEHVLKHKPDMVFLEFAVNDSWNAAKDEEQVLSSMEYIVRTLLKTNPLIKIVMVYSAMRGWKACGGVHEKVARHYQIPSIDIQEYMRSIIENGLYSWDDLFADDVHPNDKGHELYSQYIINRLEKDWSRYFTPGHCPDKKLGKCGFGFPRIVGFDGAMFSGEWRFTRALDGWINIDPAINQSVLMSRSPGSTITLPFYGRCIAVYHYISRDSGICAVRIDDEVETRKDFFYDTDGELISFYSRFDLDEGKHNIRIEVFDEKNERSKDYVLAIAGFMID